MKDADLAKFLGIDADHPNLAAFMAKLDPAKRASYERMYEVCGELALWETGLGPKPKGVLIDMDRTPKPKLTPDWIQLDS